MGRRNEWGYKGTKTALNGLTKWVEMRMDFKGKTHDRYIKACNVVVDYVVKNIPEFNSTGNIESKAMNAAALINKNGLFANFMKWFKDECEPTLQK